MAEVKNAFIKSKMNKDLDARLIPQGEYRDAVNIQVSKSEGDDVGALENVVGNISIADLELGIPNLSCIGKEVDETNSTVYLFFTDNPDTSFNYTPTGVGSNHFIYRYNAIGNSLTKLVEGAFLNFSKAFPITGVNILENLLFFTDNRNQPRKINVDLANQFGQANYYTNEDQISVSKYFPYEPIEVIKESTLSPGDFETTMKDVFSQYIPLDDSSYITNPYWAGNDAGGNPNFPGDPQYLEDKFVRFSYRFKFDDGEYSLIAPFTQVCFIPKQDGYFLPGDEQQTVASTIVEFMENKVNEIALQIPLPSAADDINSDFKITELDIIYKESDGLALQVVETIPVSQITGTSSVFEYVYNSTKPYKTLPENQITRVYDKVPVKALGQEVTSNRVVYANFQDKHTPPTGIDYQVAATRKNEEGDVGWAKTNIEYPNHTVKQNRNYQVGVVLADKYGRQSTVILSNNTSQTAGDYGADTVYLPYSTSTGYDSNAFIGNSLKILFNDFIQSTKSSTTGEPGLYNGDPTDPAYKPLGWYSYKIVVKQLEQEYYNVYAPGAMKGIAYYDTQANPSIPLTDENASFITLLNDNINKVPRDLSEVGPQDKQFRSSVELFGIVENNFFISYNVRGNRQYFPGRKSFTTNTIEDLFDLYDTAQFDAGGSAVIPVTSTNSPYYAFYRSESNPFIAEFITSQTASDQFGTNNLEYTNTRVYEKFENLSIFETKPVTSRIDIFWESTTAGLLEDLNTAIQQDTNGAFGIINFNYDHEEADGLQVDITGDFSFTDVQGQVIVPNSTPVLTSVYDDLDPTDNRASEFTLVEVSALNGTYKLQTNAYFYYGINAAQLESYTFTFTVETLDNNGDPVFTTPTETGSLTNNPPIINNSNASIINVARGQSLILTIDAVNGSNPLGGKETDDLSFAITSQSRNIFSISGDEVLNSDNTAVGIESFTLQVTDAGGATVSKTFNINFGEPAADSAFSNFGIHTIADGDGAAFWFTGTSGFSSLTGNEVSILGSQPPFQGWLNGYQAPASSQNNPVSNFICGGGAHPEFYNERVSGSLTQGTFFVILQPYNREPNPTGPPSTFVNLRYSIQQRPSANIGWQSLNDLNGVSTVTQSGGVPSGTWEYAPFQPPTGMTATTNTNSQYGSNGGLFVSNIQAQINDDPLGALVFAFNTIGDYRIILGNLQSSYGAYDNSVDCSTPAQAPCGAELIIGDFYNPPIEVQNPNDQQTYGSTYRYEIVGPSASCSSTFNGVYKYAKEPFAKYVTRFYNDTDFLQPYNPTTSSSFKFRRMDRVDSADGNSIYNPEHVKEGAYTAFILSNGLVNSTPQPCLY